MKAITIEDLKTKFVVAKVAPYGEVIMVPGADFDPDWEDTLEEEGFGCVFTEINDKKFTLVKLEKEEGEEETATRPEVGRRRGVPSGQKPNYWSAAEEERLLWRMGELPGTIDEKVAQLLSEFPGRTATGLLKKYQKLKRKLKKKVKAAKGKCPKCGLALDLCTCAEVERESERSEEKRLRDANREQVRKRVESEEHVSAESAGAQLDISKTMANLREAVNAMLEVTKVHNHVISRLHCAVVMQGLEAEERRGILAIPPALRVHYVKAITSTYDEEPITAFLEKAGLLVEASK